MGDQPSYVHTGKRVGNDAHFAHLADYLLN
jgi:hypothetical protein